MAFLRKYCKCKGICYEIMKKSSANFNTYPASFKEAFEHLKDNPFFDKYANKIAHLQKESPEELRQRLLEYEKSKEPKKLKADIKERPYSVAIPSEKAKPSLKSVQNIKTKKLDDIMKMELLKDKTDKEIEKIWLDYHRNKDVVISVVPKHTYAIIDERGKKFSTFVFPIPRSQGYEFIMCQFVANEVHFTPLIAYQTHKENAPECLTLTFYTDLQEEKGIVLMKGEFDVNILNYQEAQCLVNELQLYYGQNSEKRLNLLKNFTYNSANFNHMDLIAELETLFVS